MKSKVPFIDIHEDKPYENDKLDRDEEVKNICTVVSNLNPPYVMALNSGWGTGKTAFLRMMQAQLKTE